MQLVSKEACEFGMKYSVYGQCTVTEQLQMGKLP